VISPSRRSAVAQRYTAAFRGSYGRQGGNGIINTLAVSQLAIGRLGPVPNASLRSIYRRKVEHLRWKIPRLKFTLYPGR